MENCDDCQFLLDNLAKKFEEFCDTKESYVRRWLKEKLQRHFGEKISITGLPGKDSIITLTDTMQTILTEQFYTKRCETIGQEKLRIVKAAAEIIREDVKRQVYNLEKYPSFNENMRDECK